MKKKIIKHKFADREQLVCDLNGRRILEIELNVAEQKIEISVYGCGAISNPVMLVVDTQMLGHTEDK